MSPLEISGPLPKLSPGPNFQVQGIQPNNCDQAYNVPLQNLVYLPGHYLLLHTRDLATFEERHIYIRVTSTFEYSSVVRQIE